MAEKTISVQGASNSTIYTYGIGGIGVGIKNNLLGTWALIYYTRLLGLDAYLVTIALAIALIFDAISDPLVESGRIESGLAGDEDTHLCTLR